MQFQNIPCVQLTLLKRLLPIILFDKLGITSWLMLTDHWGPGSLWRFWACFVSKAQEGFQSPSLTLRGRGARYRCFHGRKRLRLVSMAARLRRRRCSFKTNKVVTMWQWGVTNQGSLLRSWLKEIRRILLAKVSLSQIQSSKKCKIISKKTIHYW